MKRMLPPWRNRPATPELPTGQRVANSLVGDLTERIADEFGGYEGLTPAIPSPGPSSDALACIADLEEQLRTTACAAVQLAEEKAELGAQLAALQVRTEGLAGYAAGLEEECVELRADKLALHDRLAALQRQNERLYVELGEAQGFDMSKDFTTSNGSPPLARSQP